MHYLCAHSPSRREWCLCAPRAAAEGAVAFWEEKIKDRKTGLWQKTALVTERDLSIARTIPVSHPVIMGFITQPRTSLMLSLHLSLSLCIYAPAGSRTAHRVRRAGRETSCKRDIWQHFFFFFFFFSNLLKEMYASKQNVVNPLAWLLFFFFFSGCGGKTKPFLSRSKAKTQQQRNVKGDFNHRLLDANRELHPQTATTGLSALSLFIHLKAPCICSLHEQCLKSQEHPADFRISTCAVAVKTCFRRLVIIKRISSSTAMMRSLS